VRERNKQGELCDVGWGTIMMEREIGGRKTRRRRRKRGVE
jgi:hypothetical protein